MKQIVVSAVLVLFFLISMLVCVPESKSSAYEIDTGSPIEEVSRSKIYDSANCQVMILRDNETCVEYIYIVNGSGCAISPRLDKDGKPVVSK